MRTHHGSLFTLCLTLILTATTALATDRKDIVDTAVGAGSFKTLAAALGAADLVDTLKGDGPFTVFAPTDEAFAKLPKGTVDSLLRPENRAKLTSILTYHVLTARVSSADALAAKSAQTVQQDSVRIRLVDGRLRINDSNVIANDIECSNGIIHVIDTVLLPPEPKGRKVVGLYLDEPSAVLTAQLHLPTKTGLVVTGVTNKGGAKKVGMKRYDVIREIDGHPATRKALASAKDQRRAGDLVRMTVIRRGKTLEFDVPVGIERH